MASYFAFPPPGYSSYPSSAATLRDANNEELEAQLAAEAAQHEEQRAWDEVQRRDRARRLQSLQVEQEQALLGEMEWVRAGGWLRDTFGRKDKARTENLRAEIRILDQERKILNQWQTYEARWRALVASTTPVVFADIPWPAIPCPTSVEGLTSEAIIEFILAPLRVRTNTISRKDRLRSSLLRWHPDKLSKVIARTIPEHLDCVQAGINSVFHALKSLQDMERYPNVQN